MAENLWFSVALSSKAITLIHIFAFSNQFPQCIETIETNPSWPTWDDLQLGGNPRDRSLQSLQVNPRNGQKTLPQFCLTSLVHWSQLVPASQVVNISFNRPLWSSGRSPGFVGRYHEGGFFQKRPFMPSSVLHFQMDARWSRFWFSAAS